MFRYTRCLATCCDRAPRVSAPHGLAVRPPCLVVVASYVLLSGLSALAVPAQDNPAKSSVSGPTAALPELVRRLGDASSLVRDAATAELFRQGPAAKNVLTEALKDPDGEIRMRAGLILRRLQQDQPAGESAGLPDSPRPTAEQRELVQQLGNPSYVLREEASRKLESLGREAKAALLEGLNDPDLEIRWRGRSILQRVMERELDARLAAFVTDEEGKQTHDFPGWKRFQELVGHDRAARQLFAAMLRCEGDLLSAYEQKSPRLAELLASRAAWMQSNLHGGDSPTPVVTAPAVAALLLTSLDPAVKDQAQNLVQLYQLLNSPATKELLAASGPKPVYTLLEKWVAGVSATDSNWGLMLALKYEMKEVAMRQATALVGKPNASPSLLHYALIAVGRFGGPEQVPLLTPLLANKTVCHRWSNQALKKNGTIDVQVRDVALVVQLRLLGKDPKQCGFKLLTENPETLYHVYTFGFIEDSERDATHAEWDQKSQGDGKRVAG